VSIKEIVEAIKMSQKKLKNRIAIVAGTVLCSSTVLFENAALGNPNNVSGTWNVEANQYTGTLVIDSNSGNLSGSIFDQSIEGFYIPGSRRIVFVRKSQGVPYQFFEGTVSSSGQQMSGQFHAWNSAGGASMNGVDFSFSATKR
jgi:hypothetical protein